MACGLASPEPLELFSGSDVRLRLEADASWTGKPRPRGRRGTPARARCRRARSTLHRLSSAVDPRQRGRAEGPWQRRRQADRPRRLGRVGRTCTPSTAATRPTRRRRLELAGGRLLLDPSACPSAAPPAGTPSRRSSCRRAPEQDQAGDRQELAPAFSPELVAAAPAAGSTDLIFRAGEGDGPWWLPMQRSFGPLYVEQVGLDTDRSRRAARPRQGAARRRRLARRADGAGRTTCRVSIPWRRPLDLEDWRLDLAGLAVGLRRRRDHDRGSGCAGDLGAALPRLRRAGPDQGRRSSASPRSAATAEFPDGAGSPDVHVVLRLRRAVGPARRPAGVLRHRDRRRRRLNRRLVVPADVVDAPALPAGRRDGPESAAGAATRWARSTRWATTFPPERGTFWFAAGVRFTASRSSSRSPCCRWRSATGSEINLLGLSRMALPNPLRPGADRAGAAGPLLDPRGRPLGHGPAHRQLLADQPESAASPAASPSSIWFKGARGPVRAHARRLPPAVRQAGRRSRSCRGWASSGRSATACRSRARPTSRSPPTCVMAGGRLEAPYKTSAVWASLHRRRRRDRLLGPVLLRRQRLRARHRRRRHRGLLLPLRPRPLLAVDRRRAHVFGPGAPRDGEARPRRHLGDRALRPQRPDEQRDAARLDRVPAKVPRRRRRRGADDERRDRRGQLVPDPPPAATAGDRQARTALAGGPGVRARHRDARRLERRQRPALARSRRRRSTWAR